MSIYITIFAVSTLFFYKASKISDAKQRWFLVLLAILPVALIAGVRDDSIGTDVLVYGKDCFLDVAQSRWYSEIDLSWMVRMEPGYLLLNYAVSRFTNSYNFFFRNFDGAANDFCDEGIVGVQEPHACMAGSFGVLFLLL